MSHKPTPEQQQVIDGFQAGNTMVVEAGAGCGKSSTLKLSANSMPRRRGIYVAYNKALADEAKASMPGTVMCRTAHSLAYGPVGSRYRDRLNGPRLPARQVAAVLGINEPLRVSADRAPLAPQQLARIVMDAIGRFCNSADPAPARHHFGRVNGYTDVEAASLARELAPLAVKAWDDLTSLTGSLKYTHDTYLKQWQLSRPVLAADYILLDEAQDISPVMASIFDSQTSSQRIMVGDSAQAIYGWRGAIDAMAKFRADQRLTLSQSFRFGPAVAAEANKWLDLLDANLRLRGFDPVPSRLGYLDAPDVVLCRSNGEAVSQLMDALDRGARAALVGGGADIRRLAEAARDLRNGRGTNHPELFAFTSWAEVKEYAEQDSGGADLRVIVKLIETWGPEAIISAVDRMSREDRAELVISTAHKAKGREWDRVRIAEDFRPPAVDEDGAARHAKDELMLAYVSVTRARLVLDRGSLSWIDDFVAGGAPVVPAPEYGPARQHDQAAIMSDAPDELAGLGYAPPAPGTGYRFPAATPEPEPAHLAPDGTQLAAACLRCETPWQECTCKLGAVRWYAAYGRQASDALVVSHG